MTDSAPMAVIEWVDQPVLDEETLAATAVDAETAAKRPLARVGG